MAWSPVEGKTLGKLSKNWWGGAGPAPIEDRSIWEPIWKGVGLRCWLERRNRFWSSVNDKVLIGQTGPILLRGRASFSVPSG